MGSKQFDKLYYLSVLAEEQNITRAAERLFVSQPALTAYLNRLEASVGVRLFDRSVTPIKITPAGRYYISQMQRLEYQEIQMMENLKRMDYSAENSLSIGIGRNRGSIWLPRILPEIYRRFPDAHLQIIEDRDENMTEKVKHGIIDVAIIESYFYIGSLAYEQMPEEVHCLVTGYENPYFKHMDFKGVDCRHPLDVSEELINQQRFICPAIMRGMLNMYTQQLFSTFRLAPREFVFISNNVTAYELAVRGVGITYLAAENSRLIKTEEKPLFIMPGGKPLLRKIYAVYEERNMTDLKRAFLECAYTEMSRTEL